MFKKRERTDEKEAKFDRSGDLWYNKRVVCQKRRQKGC